MLRRHALEEGISTTTMTLGATSSRSSERGTVPAMEIEQYSSRRSKYFDVGEEYWVFRYSLRLLILRERKYRLKKYMRPMSGRTDQTCVQRTEH